MRRALMLIVGFLVASEARSASDVYAIGFPSPLSTPIIASTCEGLDLPCRMDWESFFAPNLRPFKWSLSVFRFPAAPKDQGNQFAYVEVPYVEHGDDDYGRLQQMLGQTGPSAEQLWIHGGLGFQGADLDTQYRISRVALPSKKVTEAIGLCVFPMLDNMTTVPDRCGLLAFQIENRKFLLSSIGFAFGHDQPRSTPHYALALADENRLAETDPKAEILKSRHALEQAFSTRMENALKQARFFENTVAAIRSDNFSEADGNVSESSYLVMREQRSQREPLALYRQVVKVDFQTEAGAEWRATFADGDEASGVELLGGKQDWAITVTWETRTAVGYPVPDQQDLQLYTFYEPKAVGTDVVEDVQTAFLSVMKNLCAPLAAVKTGEEATNLEGRITVECESDSN